MQAVSGFRNNRMYIERFKKPAHAIVGLASSNSAGQAIGWRPREELILQLEEVCRQNFLFLGGTFSLKAFN